MLFGLESVDVDFTVDGDGLAAASLFKKELGGKLTVYKKFLTASLKLPGGFSLDVATARTETYPFVAAMPVVTPAHLEEDLMRRDFTVNAMAVPVAGYRFPFAEVIDPACGSRDIKNRLIRVLHAKSFEDDPTRILRAVRYSGRLGFSIEKETAALLEKALAAGFLGLVSAPRMRDEFVKALEEEKAADIFSEFNARGILGYFNPKLDISGLSEEKSTAEKRLTQLLRNFTEEEIKDFRKKFCLPSV
jgi:tRNA nucleotidyltransferase/poly(A) polymerase